jgi:flagellum-specific ATP synthase
VGTLLADPLLASLAAMPRHRAYGSVARVVGHEVEIRGLAVRVGDVVSVSCPTGDRLGEVVALSAEGARTLLFGDIAGIGRGDRVRLRPEGLTVIASDELLGRVLDGTGAPLDGRRPPSGTPVRVEAAVPPALQRRRITEALPVGVRMIDALCTIARGQRVGIFGGSGVGKSTLLGMMARGTAADLTVLGLVGERGREVREFIEDDLGPAAMQHSVVVAATSDQPPLVRLRGAFVATRIAEYFADRGLDVLLVVDSLTRLAMAQREVGLAAGEPPTARGYTPSVFSLLPRLLERAGPRTHGTITAVYTVLVEGDDMNEPIADAARSILDGHLVLSRRLADRGHFPALDPLGSLSRLASRVTSPGHRGSAGALRRAIAAATEVRDLVEVGAYVPGTNPAADLGLAAADDINAFLQQDTFDPAPFDDTTRRLAQLAERLA